jgi:hypothetical protein
MGKKRASNLTGLSHFMPSILPQSKPESVAPHGQEPHEPAQKRRKISEEVVNSDSGRYDASRLVPNYKNEHLMPEHLQKCALATVSYPLKPTPSYRLCAAGAVILSI